MAATLLGGIDPADRGIAVTDDYLYSARPGVEGVYRYSLPDLTNTEGPSTVWSPFVAGSVRAVTVNQSTGTVYRVEGASLYEVPSLTLLATKSPFEALRTCAYNPVTDTIWVGSHPGFNPRIYEAPPTGGSFTLVDDTIITTNSVTLVTEGLQDLSVDSSGNVWGLVIDGSTISHNVEIYMWDPSGARTNVWSGPGLQSPGPGLAWHDDTFIFAHDTGGGVMEWANVDQAGTLTPVDWLDGPVGPDPERPYRAARLGTTGYVTSVSTGAATGFAIDVFTFTDTPPATAHWRIGRIGWPRS